MAVRYQYNIYEQKMVDGFKEFQRQIEGPVEHLYVSEATKTSIANFSAWVDPWNPLFNDEEYAKRTRWGGLIAPPVYLDAVATITAFPALDPRGGFFEHNFLGENWQLLRPVHIGDRFHVVRKKPRLEDITAEDGSAPYHVFSFLLNDCEVYNQRDELVATCKMLFDLTVVPKIEIVKVDEAHPFQDHRYTAEELAYVDQLIAAEEIRGAEPRYWEQVQVGDELTPVTIGPTSIWDNICFFAARQELPYHPARWYREQGIPGLMQDPETGIWHQLIEWHLATDRANALGEPRPFHFGASARAQMARVVTNWMGDDGEIIALDWRHLKRTPVGDCQVGRGRVAGKRVEAGEYLVDVDVWLDNLCRGNVTEAARITVKLSSSAGKETGR